MRYVYNHLLRYAFYLIVYAACKYQIKFLSFIILFELFHTRKPQSLILILFILIHPVQLIHFNGNQGRVIDINSKQIIVENQDHQKISLILKDVAVSYDDLIVFNGDIQNIDKELHTYGFQFDDYYQQIGINDVCFVDGYDILLKGDSFKHHFYNQIKSMDDAMIASMYLKFFYQEKSDDLNDFLNQTGSYLQGVLWVISFCLSYFMPRKYVLYIQLLFLMIYGGLLGISFSIIRIISSLLISLLIKDKNQRCAVLIIILLALYPSSIHSVGFVFPIGYRLLFLFTKTQQISKGYLLSMMIQSTYFSQIYFSMVFFYRYMMMISGFLMIWMMFGFTFIEHFQFLFVFYHFLMNQLFFSSLQITGKMPVLMILWIIWLIHKKVNTYKIIVMVILIMFFHLTSPFYQVNMMNIGQGDATLLIAPFHQSVILIDTGKESEYDALKTFLMAKGIRHIDYLLLSHHDADHDGNVDNLQKDFEIINLIDTPMDIPFHKMKLYSLSTNTYDNDNDNSLIHYLNLFDFKMLFTGDISQSVELDLIHQYDLSIDLLKVAHHGSKTSSALVFLESIRPRYASISAGEGYHHPHIETIDHLSSVNAHIMVSKEVGDIEFYFLNFVTFMKNTLGEFDIIM